MQLKDWHIFWRGYVVILVEGKAPEKFINLAMIQGIQLWDVVPMGKESLMAKVAINQVKSLRPIARITKTRFRIKEKKGFPFTFRRIRGRKMFITGAIGFVVILYWLSSIIWFVDLSSQEELQILNSQEIIQSAADLGLRPGVFKTSLDIKDIERRLEIELPNLAWAGIEIQGTRAVIRIVEKKLPSEEQLGQKQGHLVATKDGVVHELLVINGQPMVQVGDTVTKGQVLLSGIVTPSLGGEGLAEERAGLPRVVRARGIVRARVWYEGEGEVALLEKGERYTGKKTMTVQLKVIDKQIILRGPKIPPFSNYQEKETVHKLIPWRNWQIPVELVSKTYHQVETYQRKLEPMEAQEIALKRAQREIDAQLPANSQILFAWEEVEETSGGIVRMKIIVEAIEEITIFQPLT